MRKVILSIGLLLATPAQATSYFHAVPAQPSPKASLISSDVEWRCTDAGCHAVRTAKSPDRNVCTRLVKAVGPLNAFVAGEAAFDAEALARCNSAAN